MYQKILVPLDGSQTSESALPHLKAIALGCNVPQVVLFRAVEPVLNPDVSADSPIGQSLMVQVEEQNYARAKEYLSNIAAKLKQDGLSVEIALNRGKAADEILEYIQKNKVDLVIMSTHGRSGVARWMMGSVAEKVARYSTAAVTLVRPSEIIPTI